MLWDSLLGHDKIIDRFRRCIVTGRLASTFLFVGPSGIGKRDFAYRLAQAMLCERVPDKDLDACDSCPSCQQVKARTHPDLQSIAKPKDKANIPLDDLIGEPPRRHREGLCHNLSIKPSREDSRKVAIIEDADTLNEEGANALLKTLEEPPPRSLLILIGTSEQRQLPTIRSRSQVIRFAPLPNDIVAQILLDNGLVESQEEADNLARYSGGSVASAISWRDAGFDVFRDELIEFLVRAPWHPIKFSKQVHEFVEEAGKETAAKRQRFLKIIEIVADVFRALTRHLAEMAPSEDEQLASAMARLGRVWPGNLETAADCVDRCVDAELEIARNANLTALAECWTDDLCRLAAGRPIHPVG